MCFLSLGHLGLGHMLTSHGKCQEEQNRADGSDNGKGNCPVQRCRIGDSPFLRQGSHNRRTETEKRLENTHRYETSDKGEEHSERRKYGFLTRIVSNHAEHRAVRDIDGGIYGHHQYVCDIRIYVLKCIIVSLRRIECKNAGYRKWQRNPQQIRTVFAPSRAGPVRNESHDRVRDGVIQLGHKKKRTCMGKAQTEYVRIKEREIVRENFPEHGRRHVTESITDFLRKFGFSHFYLVFLIIH